MTDRYAVIGHPIAHSKSPQIHAAFARETGEDLDYGAILAPLDGFAAAVGAFRESGGRGLNVTVPFKLEAFALADELTERARAAGAVNTLKFDGPVALGDNTDGAGLVSDITRSLGLSLANLRILLMGAGGAARGVVLPLLGERPAMLTIANRTVGKAHALVTQFGTFGPVRAGAYADFVAEHFDVIVNATSASLSGSVPPIGDHVYAGLALAYDMVYADKPTLFLQRAQAGGAARVADGLGMLVAQAAESFFLWRGVRPDTRPVIAKLRNG